jgi:formylglycine-generating enzyme required for sulfatase activity/DNA-directed RNA polymerase subunit RPC12/RpoP
MKTCPICQQAYSDDIEFCARDGARLSGEAREERECPYCAERILKKAHVCKHCGRDVEPMVKAETAVQTPSPAPPEEIVETPTAPPRGSDAPAAASRPAAPAKPPQFEIISEPPGKLKYVAMGMGGLILVVAAALYLSHRGVKNGEVRANPKDGLKYVWIPPGTFTMGCSPSDKECYDFEKPPHPVGISQGFWLGQTVVTVEAYKRFAGATGRQMPPEPDIDGRPLNPGWGDVAMPIVEVTWDDAQAYCTWAGGRLPTEAEWEYAARAESSAARYDGLDEIAWYANNSGSQSLDSESIWKKENQANFLKRLNENGNSLHEVGQKRANEFGLFDMLGNVWEWVNDWWDQSFYQISPPQDPMGPASGTERILRGGSWVGVPRDIRVSLRNRRNPGNKDFDLGFRCGGEMDIP